MGDRIVGLSKGSGRMWCVSCGGNCTRACPLKVIPGSPRDVMMRRIEDVGSQNGVVAATVEQVNRFALGLFGSKLPSVHHDNGRLRLEWDGTRRKLRLTFDGTYRVVASWRDTYDEDWIREYICKNVAMVFVQWVTDGGG